MPRVGRTSIFVKYSHFGVLVRVAKENSYFCLSYIASLYVLESIMPNIIFSLTKAHFKVTKLSHSIIFLEANTKG